MCLRVARGSMNRLEVSLQQAIQVLHERGWSQRRIARQQSVNRERVAGYVPALKPAISTTGSGDKVEPNEPCRPGFEGNRHT